MKDKESIIAQKISEQGKNIIFTGAGISTESGIADYRSKGGLWDKFRPIYFDEFMSSKKARIEYWQRKSQLYQDFVKAEPNPAHVSIVRLYEMGLLESVITQNIDGLHQKSGLPDEKVIELHGNTCRARCMSCGKITSIHEVQDRIESGDPAPECECGGYLKTDTISFGQAMPVAEMEQAAALSRSCDALLVIGSTLIVHPAASLPALAQESGAFTAIINLSETPYDKMFDVLIRGKAGLVLPEIIKRLGNPVT